MAVTIEATAVAEESFEVRLYKLANRVLRVRWMLRKMTEELAVIERELAELEVIAGEQVARDNTD